MTTATDPMGEMPKAYDPQSVEMRLYDWWEAKGYFKPIPDNGKKPFVISMPPPNVTGELHLGHAITATMEDLMIRLHRMQGEPTLWVPGSDHASHRCALRDRQGAGQPRPIHGRPAALNRLPCSG